MRQEKYQQRHISVGRKKTYASNKLNFRWSGVTFCIIFFSHFVLTTIQAFYDNTTISRNRNDELPHSIRRAFAPVNLITLRPSPFSIFTLQPSSPQQPNQTEHNSSILSDMLATLGVSKVETATFALNPVNDSRPMLDAYTTHGVNISFLHDVFMQTNPDFPCASRLGSGSFFTADKNRQNKNNKFLTPSSSSSSSASSGVQQQIYRVANVDVFDSPKQLVQSIQQDLAERSQPMFVHNERLRATAHADVERAEDGLHAVLGIASGFLWRVVGDECQFKRCVFLRVQVHVPLFELSLQRFGVLQNRFRQALKADQAGASLVNACQAGIASSNACSGGASQRNKTTSRACRRASEQVCSHFDLQYFGTHFVPNSIWGGSVDIVYRWVLDEKQPSRTEDDVDFNTGKKYDLNAKDGPLPASLYGTAVPVKASKSLPSSTGSSDSAVVLMEVRNCLNDYLNYQLLATPFRLDPLLCYSRLWKLATRARIVHNEIEGGSYEAQATLRDCIAQALTFSSSCWYSFNEWLKTVFHAPAMLMWHEHTTFAPMFNLLSEHEQLAACYMRRLELYSSQVRQLPARVPACVCPHSSLPIFYFDFCYWLRRHASGSVEMSAAAADPGEEVEEEDEKTLSLNDEENFLASSSSAATLWHVGGQAFTPQVCLCACDIFDPSATHITQSTSSFATRDARQAAASASPPLPTSSAAFRGGGRAALPSYKNDDGGGNINVRKSPPQPIITEPSHRHNYYYDYYSHFKTLRASTQRLGTLNADGGADEKEEEVEGSGGVCGTGQALSFATRSSITSRSANSRTRNVYGSNSSGSRLSSFLSLPSSSMLTAVAVLSLCRLLLLS